MARRRRPNPRLAKIHRNYTVDEVARTLAVHKNTVRNWTKQGLPTIDRQRPTLIHGLDLMRFLEDRRKAARQVCPPGHLYCVKCRAPKVPAGGMVEYVPVAETSGNLRAICPDCETLIHRRVNLAKLPAIQAGLEITLAQALPRIRERRSASVNCDFSEGARDHENS